MDADKLQEILTILDKSHNILDEFYKSVVEYHNNGGDLNKHFYKYVTNDIVIPNVSLLHFAVIFNDLKSVKYLCENGVNSEYRVVVHNMKYVEDCNQTAKDLAVQDNKHAIVFYLESFNMYQRTKNIKLANSS